MNKYQREKEGFMKTRLAKDGGSSFECSDYEGILADMWQFIQNLLEKRDKEWIRNLEAFKRGVIHELSHPKEE